MGSFSRVFCIVTCGIFWAHLLMQAVSPLRCPPGHIPIALFWGHWCAAGIAWRDTPEGREIMGPMSEWHKNR